MRPISASDVERALRQVIDPEMGISVVDLGLIYAITVGQGRQVDITMTLTTPDCPMGKMLPEACKRMVSNLTGAEPVNVHMAWDPVWTPERVSAAGRVHLGMSPVG